MSFNSRCASILAVAGTALPLFFAQAANAQISFTTIVSFSDPTTGAFSQVPGLPADQYAAAAAAGATIVYNNPAHSSPGLSIATPVIDGAGNVYWYAAMSTLTGPPPTLSPIIGSNNSTALFTSSAASGYAYNNISIFARDGSSSTASPNEGGPTPSNPNNWVVNSTSGGAGLGSGLAVSDNGNVLFGAQLNGGGATSTNNTALFVGTGTAGGQSQQVIRSAVAPGSGGLVYNTQFNATMSQTAQWAVNPSGQFAFSSALAATAGGTTTSSGLYLNSSSGVAPIYTQGDIAPGTGGAAFGASTSGTNGTSARINSSGDVVFSNTLTGASTQPSLWLNDGGSGQTDNSSNHLIMMGGGLVGAALPGVTYNAGSAPAVSNQAISNRNGGSATVMFGATLTTGSGSTPITAATNQALLTYTAGVTSVVVQNGVTPLPTNGFGSATMGSLPLSNFNVKMNGKGDIAFTGALAVAGGITSTNNNGLWLFSAASNSFQLIAQAGMVAPFSGGSATFGNGFFGVVMNNSDDIIFGNTLSDGRADVWVWGPNWGLVPIKNGSSTLLNGTNFLTNVGYGGGTGSASNGDGGVQNFNDNGVLTFTAGTAAANGTIAQGVSIVVAQLPAPGTGALGLLGLAAIARRRRN